MPTKDKMMSFGSCTFERTIHRIHSLSSDTKVLDIVVPFEGALKLNLAIDECVRRLNRYNKNTIEGKKAALQLDIYLHKNRIMVLEGSTK